MITSGHLTYAAVFLAVLAEQLGLPFPSPVFLMTAGALSAQEQMQPSVIVLVGMIGCLVADTVWFCLGRRWGSQILRLLCRFAADPRRCSQNADKQFRRYGPPILSVAKFVPGLNLLMPPLAGAEAVSLPVFLAFDLLAAFLWSTFYTALGHLFSSELDVAIGWVKQFSFVLGAMILGPLSVFAVWRGLMLLRMIRRLRLRRVSPAMLARKLKSKSRVAVLDLLNFEGEADSESREVIPGAMRVDPLRLRNTPHLTVPKDADIVLYSSYGGDAVPARGAMDLQRIGINNVWVLQGGLRAWRAQGFPVAKSPEQAEVVAAQVGVTLPSA